MVRGIAYALTHHGNTKKVVDAFEEEGTNGFGYDLIFISEDGNGKTTASMPISFKKTYSHRAKAVKKLISYLEAR